MWQGAAIILLLVANASTFYFSDVNGFSNLQAYRVSNALEAAISRDIRGKLVVKDSGTLRTLRDESPSLWFIVRDTGGQRVKFGRIPESIETLAPVFDRMDGTLFAPGSFGRQPIASTTWADSAAGRVQIIVHAEPLSPVAMGLALIGTVLNSALYIVAFATIATLIVTPQVVRHALSPLRNTVREAERIDIRRGGTRLPTDAVPEEIMPLVRAVNDGLERLDEGYERHRRFLADAAHELRTPIAIVATRASALPPSSDRIQLLADLNRLNTLAGQLLDVQRLDNPEVPDFAAIDLVIIAQDVLMNLSPSAIDAGYDVTFDPAVPRCIVLGDEGAVRRAVTNLVQNAIDHGGNSGEIAVAILPEGVLEVRDDGPGIPSNARDEVFEPFHRLTRGGNGAGLGLNLVQQIMRMHDGDVEIVNHGGLGTRVRLIFREQAIDT